jgi:ketosteroid isomerase-like protein
VDLAGRDAVRGGVRELLPRRFTVRDGKIISVREYMDTLRAKNVLFAQAPADVPATGR